MIDHNHPAVEAAARNAYERAWGNEREPWSEVDDLERDEWRADQAHSLTAALPHLTSATEENLARLRNTEAGRALMAEGKSLGWDDAIGELRKGQEMHRALAGTLSTRKPNYEET